MENKLPTSLKYDLEGYRGFGVTEFPLIFKEVDNKVKIYNVDWFHNGFCYRTTMGCDWEAVKDCKRTAKLLGEKIEYEFDHYRTDTYTLY